MSLACKISRRRDSPKENFYSAQDLVSGGCAESWCSSSSPDLFSGLIVQFTIILIVPSA